MPLSDLRLFTPRHLKWQGKYKRAIRSTEDNPTILFATDSWSHANFSSFFSGIT